MRFKFFRSLLFFFAVASFSISGLSQTQSITREQFLSALRNAYDAGDNIFPHRKISEIKEYKDGKLASSSKDILDYLAEDKIHQVYNYRFQGKPRILEMIRIGSVYYCREGMAKWKREDQNCGHMEFNALPIVVTQVYSEEEKIMDGKRVIFYHSYLTHRGWQLEKVESSPLRYSEDNLWVNLDGSIQRREMADGFVEPNVLSSSQTELFEYNLKIPKIVAPIK